MAWEDLDLGLAEWRQPGTKNKTGKPHAVPLGRSALELLLLRWEAAGRPSEGLVLLGVRGGGRMDANLSDLQGLLREVTGIAFRLHDLRRSAVSAMAEHGVDFAVAELDPQPCRIPEPGRHDGRLPARRAERGQAAGDGDLGGRALPPVVGGYRPPGAMTMKVPAGTMRKLPAGAVMTLPAGARFDLADIVEGEFGEPVPFKHKFIITDIVVDPDGRLGAALAEKNAEREGKGRARRRRRPDVEFDEALLAELARRRFRLGVNKACIEAAIEVSAKLKRHLSWEGARTRIAELGRASRGRMRWREKTGSR